MKVFGLLVVLSLISCQTFADHSKETLSKIR